MIVIEKNNRKYRIPNGLNEFQLALYLHLIDWKWKHGIWETGKSHGLDYDAILPSIISEKEEWPHLYPEIHEALKQHRDRNKFRIHKHFYHMASSQAANINLFLPILHNPSVNAILGAVKPDFATLATDQLDQGYCLEFWGGNYEETPGESLLGDKTAMSGTDSDIAIAYRNHEGELCLWLIEHKLTEAEFTPCGGFKSKNKGVRHDCTKSFAEILSDRDSCYYHNVRKFKYWDITSKNREFFPNHAAHSTCPFKGGMNQLWRNQLLGLAIEGQPYQHVSFSVVRHPGNTSLNNTIKSYRDLVADNPKFSALTSADFINAAEKLRDDKLALWIDWYKELYDVERWQIIIQVGCEGGDITLYGKRHEANWVFKMGTDESSLKALFDEGDLPETLVSESGTVSTWPAAIQLLNKYPHWPSMFPLMAHPEFSKQIHSTIVELTSTPNFPESYNEYLDWNRWHTVLFGKGKE